MSMDNQVPQSPAPGQPPGTAPVQTVPQRAAAAMAGPDSAHLPPNPAAAVRGQPTPRDYQASYEGLNQWMTTEFQTLRTAVGGLTELPSQVAQIAKAVEALGQQAPAPVVAPAASPPQAPAPAPAYPPVAPEPTDAGMTDAQLYSRVAQLEAERLKFALLMDYAQPGQPGEGVPLITFRDNIPTVAPVVNADGSVNNEGQKQAVENFIKTINSVKGTAQAQTQQALIGGFTPGVSPGAPTDPTQADLEAEYLRVKELYGSAELDTMPKVEQDKVMARYYQLHDEVGKHMPSQTEPWMDTEDVGRFINQIKARVGHLEGLRWFRDLRDHRAPYHKGGN